MERSIFTTDVIAQTIQKLTQVFEDENFGKRSRKSATPPAFAMRTTIQALSIYPKLNTLIINCLQRMVKTGKIVKYDWIWEGFVKLVQRLHKTKTYPYELVLMLPYDDFKKMCESFKKKSEIKEFNTTILTYMDHFKRDMYLDKRDYLKKSLTKKNPVENSSTVEEPDEKRAKIDEKNNKNSTEEKIQPVPDQ